MSREEGPGASQACRARSCPSPHAPLGSAPTQPSLGDKGSRPCLGQWDVCRSGSWAGLGVGSWLKGPCPPGEPSRATGRRPLATHSADPAAVTLYHLAGMVPPQELLWREVGGIEGPA